MEIKTMIKFPRNKSNNNLTITAELFGKERKDFGKTRKLIFIIRSNKLMILKNIKTDRNFIVHEMITQM